MIALLRPPGLIHPSIPPPSLRAGNWNERVAILSPLLHCRTVDEVSKITTFHSLSHRFNITTHTHLLHKL